MSCLSAFVVSPGATGLTYPRCRPLNSLAQSKCRLTLGSRAAGFAGPLCAIVDDIQRCEDWSDEKQEGIVLMMNLNCLVSLEIRLTGLPFATLRPQQLIG